MSMEWFVTGASSGIGAGAVKVALAAGDRVVAIARTPTSLPRVAFGWAGNAARDTLNAAGEQPPNSRQSDYGCALGESTA